MERKGGRETQKERNREGETKGARYMYREKERDNVRERGGE